MQRTITRIMLLYSLLIFLKGVWQVGELGGRIDPNHSTYIHSTVTSHYIRCCLTIIEPWVIDFPLTFSPSVLFTYVFIYFYDL